MNENQNDHLGQNLVYEDNASLQWQVVGAGDDLPDFSQLESDNEKTFQVIAALDRILFDTFDEETERHAPELTRIEHKLNMVIDLILLLLRQFQAQSESVPVLLTAQSLQWSSKKPAPAVGDYLLVDVYLGQGYPKPIRFYGSVESVQQETDLTSTVLLKFERLGEAELDSLERLIFRQHRRRVAKARREKNNI